MDMYTYKIEGDGFSLTIKGAEDFKVGHIVEGVMDATLGVGDSITVTRLANS
jgi:hypothetical protein